MLKNEVLVVARVKDSLLQLVSSTEVALHERLKRAHVIVILEETANLTNKLVATASRLFNFYEINSQIDSRASILITTIASSSDKIADDYIVVVVNNNHKILIICTVTSRLHIEYTKLENKALYLRNNFPYFGICTTYIK